MRNKRNLRWGAILLLAILAVGNAQIHWEGYVPDWGSRQVFGLSHVDVALWHYFTYFLVHVNAAHLIGNAFSLGVSKGAVELSTPAGTVPFVFLVSALVGGLFQMHVPSPPLIVGSVGASGGVIGVATFGVVLRLFRPDKVPFGRWLMAVVILSVTVMEDYVGFLNHGFVPRIHLGGYFAGLALAAALILPATHESTVRWPTRVSAAGKVCGMLIIGIAAVITALIGFAHP